MNLYQSFLYLFKKPPAQKIVQDTLEDYQRLLLSHEASCAYHEKMAQYYAEGIHRLTKFKPVPTTWNN